VIARLARDGVLPDDIVARLIAAKKDKGES
jgi:hypothetical protein